MPLLTNIPVVSTATFGAPIYDSNGKLRGLQLPLVLEGVTDYASFAMPAVHLEAIV
jgi:hypothetical protein